jgi:hypothetical protein
MGSNGTICISSFVIIHQLVQSYCEGKTQTHTTPVPHNKIRQVNWNLHFTCITELHISAADTESDSLFLENFRNMFLLFHIFQRERGEIWNHKHDRNKNKKIKKLIITYCYNYYILNGRGSITGRNRVFPPRPVQIWDPFTFLIRVLEAISQG